MDRRIPHVVNDRAFDPGQKRWQHKADALT